MLCRVSVQALWLGRPGREGGQCASARGWRGSDVTVCDAGVGAGTCRALVLGIPGRGLHVTAMFGSSRGGVRGGQDQFSWEDVKTDKQRENYLGEWGAGTRSSRAVGSPSRGPCGGLGVLFPQATR